MHENYVRRCATKTPAWQHLTAAPSVIFLRVNAQMLNLDLAKKRTLSRNRYVQVAKGQPNQGCIKTNQSKF